jgi:uncharacterized protein (TIRG00374 family)
MRRLLVSFGSAVLLLAGFVALLNPARLAAQLADASLSTFLLGPVAVLGAMLCWSEASRLLFASSASRISSWRAFLAYGAGAFGKLVLPMGNAGGPAVMAYAFEREVDVGYSRSLAVIAVAEFLSLLASILLALAGVAVLLAVGVTTPVVRLLGVAALVVAVALAAFGVVVWYRRTAVSGALVTITRFVEPAVRRVSPGVAARLAPDRVTAGLEHYYETFDAVVADRRTVVVAFLVTQLGWLLFALPLFTSALALGTPVPVALALFMVPAVGVATVVPLPGGLGGIEFALVGLLTTLAALDLTGAGAVVVLYRLCSFWFFVLVGGLSAWAATVGVRDLPASLDEPAAALEGGVRADADDD